MACGSCSSWCSRPCWPPAATARPAPPPPVASGTDPPVAACQAGYEAADSLSPSYRPGAPVRAVVGQGHVLTGTVRSSHDCAPIAGARVDILLTPTRP
jgi:hypothetical protein